MFDTFIKKVKIAFTDPVIRKRILYTLGGLFLFRILATVPAPGIGQANLAPFFADNQFLGLLNIFTGGGLSSISIVMLGIGPYITAAITMQLLTVMSPRLKSLYHDEGQAGKRKFTQYSRLLTVPLAALQSFGFLTLLQQSDVIGSLEWFPLMTNIIVITAGAVLLMWIGELITEFGVGNGISLLIFAGIVAQLPSTIDQLILQYTPQMLPTYLGFVAISAIIVWGIVVVTEAARPVPITYAKQRGQGSGEVSTYLPLKVNQAGVMPIIFALSIMLFPQMVVNFLGAAPDAGGFVGFLQSIYESDFIYAGLYFILVFLFTFFYTAITFEPDSVADNLQKSGAFIPGIRPGESTRQHITHILTRVTFIGAIFLGLIAVLPIIMQQVTNTPSLAIGGTALLIVVAVLVDLIKRLDGQIAMRQY
ncbi:MAG: preprotein translocase subunit SecY [Candidatus Paceibacterota bacterium]